MRKKTSDIDAGFVQKWILEIRYLPRPSMMSVGGILADAWTKEFPEAEVQIPVFRLNDRKNYRSLVFGVTNVIVDVEGEKDFETVMKLLQRVAGQFLAEGKPPAISRLGLRYILLCPGETRSHILSRIGTSFFSSGQTMIETPGRDQISDIGIVLDYNSIPARQGRIAFGPYVPEANLVSFSYQSHPHLQEVKDGYIYDCDFGTIDPPVSILKSQDFLKWAYDSYAISRDRVRSIHGIAFQGE